MAALARSYQCVKAAAATVGVRISRHTWVHDDLWVWHIPGPNVLCLRCAEKRLGRAFVASDFRADLPVNAWIVDAFSCGIDPATVHGESPIKSHHDAVRKACVRFPVGGQTSTLNKIRSIQPLKLAGTDTVY